MFQNLIPVQQNPVKVKMFAFQLQVWLNTPAGEVDNYTLWIVLDRAHYTVFHFSGLCWISPNCQILAGKTIQYTCKQCLATCCTVCRVTISADIGAVPVSALVSETWLVGPVDMWQPGYLAGNGTEPQRPGMNYYRLPASLCSLGTYVPCTYTKTDTCISFNTKAQCDTNTWYIHTVWYHGNAICSSEIISNLSLVLPQISGPNSKYPGLIT